MAGETTKTNQKAPSLETATPAPVPASQEQGKKSALTPKGPPPIVEANPAEAEPAAPGYSLWDDLRDSLPPWLDELVAIFMLLFGVLSFVALLFPPGAETARAWAQILMQLFGWGSVLVAGCILAIGIFLLLPRVGIAIRLSAGRILALEMTFLCLLALLHVSQVDTELRALVRAGTGGGLIGWGLTVVPAMLFGRSLTILIYGALLFFSLAGVFGIRRAYLINLLNSNGQRLLAWGEKMRGTQQRVVPVAPLAPQRTSLYRIRPDHSRLPPSLRPGAVVPRATKEEEAEIIHHPLFNTKGREMKVDVNLVGEPTGKRDSGGYTLVRRPDGREKRYFAMNEMKELKKIVKRENPLPPMELLGDIPLNAPDEGEINHTVVLIENTLLEFDIDIDVIDVQVGPTVTRYALQPFRANDDGVVDRTRLSKIASYVNDLSLALSAKRLRMELPVPGTTYMGIEVPNKQPSTVALRSVMESKAYADLLAKTNAPLLVPLGRDVSGQPIFMDIAKMPHTLIAGTTGSGKSVCIAALAAALLLNNGPERLQLVMLDPKMVELSRFNGLPHLIGPVETDTERIIGVLKWCTQEMDRRYKLLEEHAVRNIDNYNAKFGTRRRGKDYMPHIVILIDEIGDLMLSRPEETETSITRLAQMARAVGMHLIVATQRPSVDVITGLIKANFPARIAFSVASNIDSRVILDSAGAEALLGHGDMLFLAPDAGAPRRVQGCYVSDEEVRSIVKHWVDWARSAPQPDVEPLHNAPWERGLTRREILAETDPMLEAAIEYVVETQEASASLLQRKLGLGYPRAARLMDLLGELGVVGELVGGGRARRVLIAKGDDPFKRILDKRLRAGKSTPASETFAEDAAPDEAEEPEE